MRGSSILALSAVVREVPRVTRVPFPADAAPRIPLLLAQVHAAGAYRRVLGIKLARDGKTAAEIARLLGWNPNSVPRVWGRYRAEGEVALLGRPGGGRRHAYLTPAAEDALLAPFLAEAEAGGVLVAGPIQAADEARVGQAVPPSPIYRRLARHGGRTVAPRRRHPAQPAGLQAAVNRNAPRWGWMRSPATRPLAATADQAG